MNVRIEWMKSGQQKNISTIIVDKAKKKEYPLTLFVSSFSDEHLLLIPGRRGTIVCSSGSPILRTIVLSWTSRRPLGRSRAISRRCGC